MTIRRFWTKSIARTTQRFQNVDPWRSDADLTISQSNPVKFRFLNEYLLVFSEFPLLHDKIKLTDVLRT